jgi:hypothetical protein
MNLSMTRAILWRTPKAASVLEGDYSIRQWGADRCVDRKQLLCNAHLVAVKRTPDEPVEFVRDGTECHDLSVSKREGGLDMDSAAITDDIDESYGQASWMPAKNSPAISMPLAVCSKIGCVQAARQSRQ